jgi:hypothetical protein
MLGTMPKLGPSHSCAALIAERKVWMGLKLSPNDEAAFPGEMPLLTDRRSRLTITLQHNFAKIFIK